jgi:IgA Peptidase M64/von Willebrand factor type A domain
VSASDGYVVAGSTTKIVDHGPEAARWNMVILSEGYQASELSKFHDDAQRFVDRLYATAPFNQLWCGINVFRVDVVSNGSGADYPATCPDDGPGDGVPTSIQVATYFDASFCRDNTRRLLYGDETLALNVARAAVPHMHVTMVIVNSSRYGGAGGGVGWFSTDSRSAEIGIHEMGHTYFKFGDEYGDRDAHFTGSEPIEQANVTTITNRATTKWHDLIAASTPLPTMTNGPGCTSQTTAPSPVPSGTVGLFGGGSRAFCDIYHPEYDCKMQHLSVPFCSVCQRKIRSDLSSLVPPTTVNLTTPSVDFGGVPQGVGGTGVTTYRAVAFEVSGCGPVTLQIISGPTGGFGTPLGTSITVPPDEYAPLAHGRLWLSYTSSTPGSTSSGTVTVRWSETGQTWTISLSAHTVARPKSAIVLVLDRSGSMSEDSGDGTPKVAKLKQAVSTFAGLMLPGDGLGIVRFDDTVQRLLSVTDVGPVSPVTPGSGRDRANQIVAGNELDPAGATSIGGGVAEGKATLDAAPATTPPWAVKAMIVVTDGVENTPPMISSVGSSVTANTFAIGIGLPANISVAALNALTLNHLGYLVVTGTITSDVSFRLTKYFLQALAGITNAAIVIDPQGRLPRGAEHRIPFSICEADIGFDAIVLCDAPELLAFELEAPDGTRIDPSAAAQSTIDYFAQQEACFYRVSLPALRADASGTHAGRWHIVLRLASREKIARSESRVLIRRGDGGLPYNALVHAYSDIDFSARLHQTANHPGADAIIEAGLREYDVPLARRADVWADISDPADATSTVVLDQVAEGRFRGRFTTNQPGVYVVRLRAKGTDIHGYEFTREQTLTASVWIGDGSDSAEGSTRVDWFCEVLHCVFSERVLSGRAVEALEQAGIDIAELRRCLEACSREPRGQLR